jgi:tetratricopeptide (TPR) repeat protein
MNEEEKGIEIPCDSCGRLLHVLPGEHGLTTNYKEYEEEKVVDCADIIIGSSANRFVLNMPGIVCNGDCSLELLDTVPDPPGLVCVVEITPAKAASAMMEMQFVNGTEAAVDFFLQLFPTSAEVMDIAAIRLHQEGDKERAYEIIEHGIKHSDDADKLRMELAAFTGMDNDPQSGLEIMRDVSPDAIRYHVVKGNLYRAAEQWGEAADCWKMAIETDPSDEIAWFNLGYYLLSVEERFLDAEQHYQAACDAFPEERRFRAYLGDALFFQGRKAEALKEYHRALPMQGGDSQFEDTLRSMIDQCE